jgi:hypothetical protein
MSEPLAPDDGALDGAKDAGYPTRAEPDSLSPCRTQKPLLPLFEGVALPATWSRLGDVVDRAFHELWQAHGVPERHRPDSWTSLHYGRIYLNAHAFERLRATVGRVGPDPALVPPELGLLPRLKERLDVQRAYGQRRGFAERLRRAEERAAPILVRVGKLDVAGLDTRELARGALDRAAWIELMLPWLGSRVLAAAQPKRPEPPAVLVTMVREAIRFEQRCAAELGRRFVKMNLCSEVGDIAYLTLDERVIALRQPIQDLAARIAGRRARVASFVALELPLQFSGSLRPLGGR